MDEIVNKVAQSGIVTIDPGEWFPEGDRVGFDISPLLFEGLLLREKDFREHIRSHDWSQYQNKHLALFCSSDAIIPRWAWMLLASAFQPYAATLVFGTLETLEAVLFRKVIEQIDPEAYRGQRVVVKGCGEREVPVEAYMELTRKLQPVVKSIMYGEPCSTVPVYKAAKP
jgi:hypothetical protein